jgi:uncharacterized membrane protein
LFKEFIMIYGQRTPIAAPATVLPYNGIQALIVQTVLIASTVLLPTLAHTLGAPVRLLVPMHWPIILAGMLYGWRAGALTGAVAPVVSFLFSGYPLPNILPSMTVELLAYGAVAGLLRERYQLNAFASIASAIVVGRIVFFIMVIVTHRASVTDTEYFSAALIPGIAAALLQIFTLPFLSQWLVKRFHQNGNR